MEFGAFLVQNLRENKAKYSVKHLIFLGAVLVFKKRGVFYDFIFTAV